MAFALVAYLPYRHVMEPMDYYERKVEQEAEPICDLKYCWNTFPGSLRIGSCSATTDDFNPWMNGEARF